MINEDGSIDDKSFDKIDPDQNEYWKLLSEGEEMLKKIRSRNASTINKTVPDSSNLDSSAIDSNCQPERAALQKMSKSSANTKLP